MCQYHSSDFYPRPPGGGRQHLLQQSGVCRLISIHALRAEGDGGAGHRRPKAGHISIHALRAEGDRAGRHWSPEAYIFLSTPSGRRATVWPAGGLRRSRISIHALRTEGDGESITTTEPIIRYFYPRPPDGGRQQKFTKYCLLLRHKHENSSF